MNIQYFQYSILYDNITCILYGSIWQDILNEIPTLQTGSGEIEQMVRSQGR